MQAGARIFSLESLKKVDGRVVDEATSTDADETLELIKLLESAG